MKKKTEQHSSERAVARERFWAARGFWFLIAMLLSAFALLMKFLGFFVREGSRPVEAEEKGLMTEADLEAESWNNYAYIENIKSIEKGDGERLMYR